MRASTFILAGVLAGLAGCAAHAVHDGDSQKLGEPRSDAGGTASEGSIDDAALPELDGLVPLDAAPAEGECPAEAQMIYVTGIGAELWSFWPPTFTFKKIGRLTCTDFPTHMTVDRNGTAWVVGSPLGSSPPYPPSKIFKTSTKDATCTELASWPSPSGFYDPPVSMVGVTSKDTTLYVLGATDLGKFDVATGAFAVVGPLGTISDGGVRGRSGDMTSNGDGTLYFMDNIAPIPAQSMLFNISPATAAVMKSAVMDPNCGSNQALAWFGGRFYLFIAGTVYEYDPKAKTTKAMGKAPMEVTGAGQSTCVPSVPTDAGPPR